MSESLAETETMLSEDGDQILVIEYRDEGDDGWKPFSVITKSDTYDCQWCPGTSDLVSHSSGSGMRDGRHELSTFCHPENVCCKLWLAPGIKLVHEKKVITTEAGRLLGYEVVDEPLNGNPFDDAITGDSAEYCSQCKSYVRNDSWGSGIQCNHLKWEDECGYSLGCGADSIDFSEVQSSLYDLLNLLPAKAVKTIGVALTKDFAAQCRYFGECPSGQLVIRGAGIDYRLEIDLDSMALERDAIERYWPGIAWLTSLDEKTPEAMALTCGWVWQFQNSRHPGSSKTYYCRLPKRQLDSWLAMSPYDMDGLRNRSLRIRLPIKAESLHDKCFMENPSGLKRLVMWPNTKRIGDRSLELCVAEVLRTKTHATIWFSRILSLQGVQITLPVDI